MANASGSTRIRSDYVRNQTYSESLQETISQNEYLAEAYGAMARAVLAIEDEGWSPIAQFKNRGFSLDNIKQISATAREQTQSNPLLKRGARLRASYVFGRGYKFGTLAPRYQKIIDDPVNQEVLFSNTAGKKNCRTLFTDGNFYVRYDTVTKKFSRVPLSQITDIATDPDDEEMVRYYKRSYDRKVTVNGTEKTQPVEVWYPVDRYQPSSGGYFDKIGDVPVDTQFVIFDMRKNDDSGSFIGVPDCLPALPWAWAYSEYLKDGSKLLKALAQIAWHVRSKTGKGVNNASAKIAGMRTAGSTAATSSEVDIQALPRANAVDLQTGRPLAAMAATAMEVSVTAILSDVGQGGSNASEKTLDQPTINAALADQEDWIEFFKRVLKYIGVPDAAQVVKFNKIVVDPTYRNVQNIGQAWDSGTFKPEIINAAYAEELDLEPGGIPEGVMIPNNEKYTGTLSNDNQPAGASGGSTVATGQGKSGAGVGDIANDNDQRANGEYSQ